MLTDQNQTIQDLDWASTPDNQSILAVGFSHTVFVYTQLRYDYVNERPSWSRIKEVNTRHLSPHPIGDSVWLDSGNLVVGAGNQLYLAGNQIDPQKDLSPDLQSSTPHKSSTRIQDVVRRLNGPLPVFHPQFISQCILAGKMDIVHRILLNLQKTLKFYTEGDELDSFQGLDIDDFMSSTEVCYYDLFIHTPANSMIEVLKLKQATAQIIQHSRHARGIHICHRRGRHVYCLATL